MQLLDLPGIQPSTWIICYALRCVSLFCHFTKECTEYSSFNSIIRDLTSAGYHIQLNLNTSSGIPGLFDPTGLFINTNFSLLIGDQVQTFSVGNPASSVEMDAKFISGNLAMYPFDTWLASIDLDARFNGTEMQIPINVCVYTGLMPYYLYNNIQFDSKGIKLTITRSDIRFCHIQSIIV